MFETITRDGKVLVRIPQSQTIPDAGAALELAVSARHETGSDRLVVPKECFPKAFFHLSSGLAGEILQKWVNYQFTAAIYGDFSEYTSTSKPLRDFIYECSRGNTVFFVATRQEAEERLCRV